MVTYLDAIVAEHRLAARSDRRQIDGLIDRAHASGTVRGFAQRLRSGTALIAEIKRRSPSKGYLNRNLDPPDLAVAYQSGGAACLSVLTDRQHFGGSTDDLVAARAACDLPVLRKDFVVSAAGVCDTRIIGADAMLLIAAALDDTELADFHTLGVEIGLDVLVEVHDEHQIERAVTAGAAIIGVNQRDLVSFAVDPDRAARLVGLIPEGVLSVAESGVSGPVDAHRLFGCGYDALLVGEALVTTPNPRGAVAAMLR